jgi:Uma2 family endonuclease
MAIATEATAESSSSKGMSVEEYLRTSFDPDCEYVDGEVLSRNAGLLDHGLVQKALLLALMNRQKELGVVVLPSQRLRLNPTHYRIPDLIIVEGGKPTEQTITGPPLVCIEVLSPEDCMSRMQYKVADYLEFGVRYVWILDPLSKQVATYTESKVHVLTTGVLRTENPAIEIPLSEIFE